MFQGYDHFVRGINAPDSGKYSPEVFLNDMRDINPRFTYLFTYLATRSCRTRKRACPYLLHVRLAVLLLQLMLLLLLRQCTD